jgi:hypothetical protein
VGAQKAAQTFLSEVSILSWLVFGKVIWFLCFSWTNR